MGVLTTTREMPAATKIKRGLGILLIGALGTVVGNVMLATSSMALGYLGLLVTLVSFVGCGLVGLALLLWGLLRE